MRHSFLEKCKRNVFEQATRRGRVKNFIYMRQDFRLNLPILFYFLSTTLIGVVSYPVWAALGAGFQLPEAAIFVLMMAIGYFGINFGYHRGFSHRSFKMNPFLRWMVLGAAASTGEGSALFWCSEHRRHHRYQDQEKDPYGIQKGFWWAHMGWMLQKRQGNFKNCKDLLQFRSVRLQHSYYWILFFLTSFGLPFALGLFFGRGLEALLLAGFSRLVLMNHVTYLINSAAHSIGRKPYDKSSTARDSHVLAFLTAGEGYHNYHHRYPFDYRNGHKALHWDPTKWLIFLLSKLGLVSDLKRRQVSTIKQTD